MATTYTLDADYLDGFRRSWPAHGLPDNLAKITVEIDDDGVSDITTWDDQGRYLDSHPFDEPAMAAIVAVHLARTRSKRKTGDNGPPEMLKLAIED